MHCVLFDHILDDMDLEGEVMEIYLGPQLPKEREAVGLLPRVSFRSCLQRAKGKHEEGNSSGWSILEKGELDELTQ